MAINKNHEFEELDGVKCAIVEKNVSQERIDFLKDLLEFNNYTVVVIASAPPKAAPIPKPVTPEGEIVSTPVEDTAPPAPATFTIGVTDVRFNATNAIFGRMLQTKNARTVTLAYWQQKEAVPNDEIPYFHKSSANT